MTDTEKLQYEQSVYQALEVEAREQGAANLRRLSILLSTVRVRQETTQQTVLLNFDGHNIIQESP